MGKFSCIILLLFVITGLTSGGFNSECVSLTYNLSYPSTLLFIHSPVHIHFVIYPFIHPSISNNPFINPSIDSFIYISILSVPLFFANSQNNYSHNLKKKLKHLSPRVIMKSFSVESKMIVRETNFHSQKSNSRSH